VRIVKKITWGEEGLANMGRGAAGAKGVGFGEGCPQKMFYLSGSK